MNSLKVIGVGMMILLIAATAGAAGPGTKGDYKQTVKLRTSDYGLEVKAFGYCSVERANGVEMFGLRVFADLPDGANLIVEVGTRKGVFEVGTIQMFLGSGALILYSSKLPSPAFPVEDVITVSVHDTTDKLLTYTWATPASSIR
jgi:hypothetical protein